MKRLTFRPLQVAAAVSALTLASAVSFADEAGKVAPKSGWLLLTADQRNQVFAFAEPYKAYLRAAKSAALSNTELLRQARDAGFTDFMSPNQLQPGARLIFNDRGRSAVLAIVGKNPLETGSTVVATHQDSPHINLKARPVVQAPGSVALLKTVYYGGIKKYQWSNLPLALVGVVNTVDGRHIDVSIGFEGADPVFVIPDNAPHSDAPLRSRTYTEILTGEELDPIAGSIPGDNDSVADEVMAVLRQRYKIRDEDLVSAELELVPATQPADVGVDRGLTGAWGQDDKLSSYCAVRALIDSKGTPADSAFVYLTNFEEVGSVNNTGARSEFLVDVYSEFYGIPGSLANAALAIRHALAHARVISSDTNDGVNPLFPQTSEASNAAQVGYGVTIKRYGAGFDPNSEFTAKILGILDRNSIPWQTQTPKVDVGGGGTIGGFLSVRDMEVIDIGIPLISMHATYEMSSKVDTWNLYRFFGAFFAGK